MTGARSHSVGVGEPVFESELGGWLLAVAARTSAPPPTPPPHRAPAAAVCREPRRWSDVRTLSSVVLMWSVRGSEINRQQHNKAQCQAFWGDLLLPALPWTPFFPYASTHLMPHVDIRRHFSERPCSVDVCLLCVCLSLLSSASFSFTHPVLGILCLPHHPSMPGSAHICRHSSCVPAGPALRLLARDPGG